MRWRHGLARLIWFDFDHQLLALEGPSTIFHSIDSESLWIATHWHTRLRHPWQELMLHVACCISLPHCACSHSHLPITPFFIFILRNSRIFRNSNFYIFIACLLLLLLMSLSASYQIQMNREHSAHLPPQRQWHLLIPQWRNAILNIFQWFFFRNRAVRRSVALMHTISRNMLMYVTITMC